MVVLLIVVMFLAFAAVSVWQKRRAESGSLALAAQAPVEEIWFHPGHAWVSAVGAGLYKVGLNELAASLAGMPEKVRIPRVGASLRESQDRIEVKSGKRTLPVAAPLSGTVVDVNLDALKDPALIAKQPYDAGWLLLVKARNLRNRGAGLVGEAAKRWLDGLRQDVGQIAHSVAHSTALDGGALRPGFGEDLTDEKFNELRNRLFDTEKEEV